MLILIYAMLLSPEINFGEITSQRAIAIRIEDLLIIVFSLAWFARLALHSRLSLIKRTPINRWIALYAAIFTLSTINGMLTNNVKPLTGIFYILKYLEYYLVFYLVLGIIKSKSQVKAYLKAFIITFAIVNIYACTQIGSGRVSAPFEGEIGEPNTLGGYQVLILSIIMGLLSHMRLKKWRWPLIALALFSLVPFAYTLSRASYLAIIPAYLTVIILHKTKRRNVFVGFLMTVIILLIFFFPKNVKDRIFYTFVPVKQEGIPTFKLLGIELGPSASARLQSWSVAVNRWQKKPYIGYGITAAGFLDSQYFSNLVELGTIGLVAFLALLSSIFRNTLRIYRNSNDEIFKGLSLGFLAGHVGLLFHAIAANTFIIIRIMEPYWFLLAMIMAIPKLEKSQENIPSIEIEENKVKSLKNTDMLLNSKIA
ncbi:MAG: O-antigen ligase family protein [Candidatus Omnitrophica bacterium]|nr:O-antigen ligase family protein [Candidatus Omnitrophota bacterium]MBU1997157.1 O-antigen ligase family protein [Candidatus Omnitrophota bacterium]MBU4333817.1 O-antigen ligase family protein [Candidatus Omnitrophota bacterium]